MFKKKGRLKFHTKLLIIRKYRLKKENRTYQILIYDIQIAMNRIAEYIKGYDFEHFKKDYNTADAVIRNFEIM